VRCTRKDHVTPGRPQPENIGRETVWGKHRDLDVKTLRVDQTRTHIRREIDMELRAGKFTQPTDAITAQRDRGLRSRAEPFTKRSEQEQVGPTAPPQQLMNSPRFVQDSGRILWTAITPKFVCGKLTFAILSKPPPRSGCLQRGAHPTLGVV